MVRKLLLAGTTIVTLLTLGSCQVAFIGVFPPAISQMTARKDLSAVVPAGQAASFNLAVVSAGGPEYVLLFSSSGFDPAQVHLVVLDSSLNMVGSFTNTDIQMAAFVYLNGQYAMGDAAGQFVAGNIRFDVHQAGVVILGSFTSSLGQPSIPNLGANEVNFSAGGGVFSYTEYDSSWTYIGSRSVALGAPSTMVNFVGAFTDADSLSAPDVFVLQDYGSQQTYILSIPKNDIAGTNLSGAVGASTVFATYNPFSKSTLDSRTVCYSRGSVVAYDHDSEALVRFPLDNPSDVRSLPLRYATNRRLALGPSGSYCVVWDPGTRTLTRYEQWW
jgi:hypothetical protein